MLRRLSAVLAMFVLAACSSGEGSTCKTGCTTESHGGQMMHGSGTINTETRQVEKFAAVHVASSADVVIERTGTESLTVTGDDNLLSLFTSEVKDGVLYLDYAQGKSFEGKRPVYRITLADLRTLTVTGSGDVDATRLEGTVLAVSITGSGDVHVTGEVEDLTVMSEGSGDLDASELKAKRAKVAVDGSGDATVNVSDELDATINGSGDISYVGSPKVTSHLAGSGVIRAKS